MKVYTRAGDDGTTGLFLGGRVSKADRLMDACGDMDEAVAALGVARAALEREPGAHEDLAPAILRRQRELFVVAADLATNPAHRDRLVPGVSLVTEDMAADVEREIDERVAARPLRPVFVVPGTTPASAALDLARAVLRRAERSVVALGDAGHPVSPAVRGYVNRLSDLLFVLGRVAAGENEPASHD
ncbi:cob(I)yrinic acid a,c-diamide adenosyltransferase [Actinotalea fermentans]|uniref:Corrinoid adenosyltransferase n=1 Tax=Actinotalea fermentans TaxID=43671 RepID=A0A511YUQ9_9CELL|nr:cob(I)yrinic acid a,c-diamide adenosyltransferase [Actinotalea fermentans]KGM17471.1 hypothetical protein N867_03000 [Actinotalea fermentans ATCC 43279 = JCM 9966 = DSM 3133]GEN78930.1 ATP--cob(I)alamin adenosyltransferase [Actinotalea fermentans]